jgi:hypothetical protein
MYYSEFALAVDIDGVAAKHMDHVRKSLNLPQINGKDYGLLELNQDDFKRVMEFMETEEFVNGCEVDVKVKEAIEFIQNCDVEVFFLTSRLVGAREATRKWVAEHFPSITEVLFSYDKRLSLRALSAAKRKQFILLDDYPYNARSCNQPGISEGIVFYRQGQEYSLKYNGTIVTVENMQQVLLERLLL